ncbi:hypothetical protein [Nocardioides campestrisoli]|uniref:hypothetical protein n=1 Tax=Nocardioides campestrisoli TaxID=2736757 RepID=UPI0015E6D33D|nr:hypothetical protein [Nocardioides campestrisoli]
MNHHTARAGVTAVLLVTALGCGADTGQGSPGAASPHDPAGNASVPPEPRAEPVNDASTTTDTPEPLATRSSSEQTQDEADSSTDRLAAENFAISFGQMIVDVREARDQEAVVDDLISTQLPAEVREFLLVDYEDQRALGSQRRLDLDFPAFVRSSIEGPADEPTRVNVELAAVFAAWDVKAVCRVRVDVIREGTNGGSSSSADRRSPAAPGRSPKR